MTGNITNTSPAPVVGADGARVDPGPAHAPMYYVAVCAKRQLPDSLPDLSLFGDREESVYAHYNHEIRKNIAAGARIAELEAEVARLGAAASAKRDWRWWKRAR